MLTRCNQLMVAVPNRPVTYKGSGGGGAAVAWANAAVPAFFCPLQSLTWGRRKLRSEDRRSWSVFAPTSSFTKVIPGQCWWRLEDLKTFTHSHSDTVCEFHVNVQVVFKFYPSVMFWFQCQHLHTTPFRYSCRPAVQICAVWQQEIKNRGSICYDFIVTLDQCFPTSTSRGPDRLVVKFSTVPFSFLCTEWLTTRQRLLHCNPHITYCRVLSRESKPLAEQARNRTLWRIKIIHDWII
jgi:hypothetical protein